MPCRDLRGLLRRGRANGTADLAMIPIENSLAGRVADIHHLLPTSGLHIVGEHFLPIHFHLMAPEGARLKDIKTVHSHIHALGQCRKIIRKHGWKPVVEGDTAGAAREIAELGDISRAALAPKIAAGIYGLDILIENVEDAAHNTTRFIILSKKDVRARQRTARSSRPLSSVCATSRRRSTRRWAASPPTAST